MQTDCTSGISHFHGNEFSIEKKNDKKKQEIIKINKLYSLMCMIRIVLEPAPESKATIHSRCN